MTLMPRMLIAGGGVVGLPSIVSVDLQTTVTPACSPSTLWTSEFSWSIDNPNNTFYYLQVIDNTTGLPFIGAEDLNCTGSGSFDILGAGGVAGGFGTFQNVVARLQIRRRSDDGLIEDGDNQFDTVESGPLC